MKANSILAPDFRSGVVFLRKVTAVLAVIATFNLSVAIAKTEQKTATKAGLKISIQETVTITRAEMAHGYILHVPTVVRFATGELLCRFYTSDDEWWDDYWQNEHSGYCLSTDGGKTWGERTPVGRFGRVHLPFADGRILELGFATVPDPPHQFRRYRVPTTWWSRGGMQRTTSEDVVMEFPFDAGLVWRSTEAGPLLDGEIIDMGQSGLLAMAYGKRAKRPDRKSLAPYGPLYELFIVASSDQGRSWRYLSTVPGSDLSEASMVRLRNGELLLISRPRMEQTRSRDGGKTWGPLEPSGPPDGVEPSLLLMNEGVLVCAYGTLARPRKTMLMFSADGAGRSWADQTLVFDPASAGASGSWAYPQVIQVGPGLLFLVYDYQVTEQGRKFSYIKGAFIKVER